MICQCRLTMQRIDMKTLKTTGMLRERFKCKCGAYLTTYNGQVVKPKNGRPSVSDASDSYLKAMARQLDLATAHPTRNIFSSQRRSSVIAELSLRNSSAAGGGKNNSNDATTVGGR